MYRFARNLAAELLETASGFKRLLYYPNREVARTFRLLPDNNVMFGPRTTIRPKAGRKHIFECHDGIP
jgi:hypothetical protein